LEYSNSILLIYETPKIVFETAFYYFDYRVLRFRAITNNIVLVVSFTTLYPKRLADKSVYKSCIAAIEIASKCFCGTRTLVQTLHFTV
jgi:hypothetical protein